MSKFIEAIATPSNGISSYSNPILELLSRRELEVLQWLAFGVSNREIGRLLYITEGTVKKHVYHIFGKLNVSNRTQAVLWAIKLGVSSLPGNPSL